MQNRIAKAFERAKNEGENRVIEAIRMLKDNIPLDAIIKKTGLTLQRLTELKTMLSL